MATAIISVVLFRQLNFFAGMGTGYLVLGFLSLLAVFHMAALIAGFFTKGPSRKMGLLLACIAMLPIGYYSAAKLSDQIHFHYYAPSERFSENLASPIPESVENIRFIPFEDSIEPHLMLIFTIDPAALKAIIKANSFVEIDEVGFRRVDDLFTNSEYLPLGENELFYQRTDELGEGHTLKVSSDFTRAIYRRESANYYRDRSWESEWSQRLEEESLARLRRSNS
ncbi:MAG: hypothetical protein AAF333_12415 [Planctomycetota bacterium]